MQNLNLKLIAVADSTKVILYEAQGLKITKLVDTLNLEGPEHYHNDKTSGHYQKTSIGQPSLYEPKSTHKDLEHEDAARLLSQHLNNAVNSNNDYKSLIIVAEPKMLGFIRQYLDENLKKKVIKEVHKDLIHHDKAAIEQAVFA